MLNEIREKTAGWLSGILSQGGGSTRIFHRLPEGLPDAAALEITGVTFPGRTILPEAEAVFILRRASAGDLNRDISLVMANLPLYDWNGIASLVLKDVEYRKELCGGRERFTARVTIAAAAAR